MGDIKQAVILAGGRGSRLAPLTNDRPKPMVEFHGKPFLAYLLEMLKEQGITRVLLLLGYLPDPVVKYFGDGSEIGLQISYSITPEEDDTGMRVKRAADRLDSEFLLMYCDNYWPLPLRRLEQAYKAAGAPIQVVVYENLDGYTRDNLRVENGFVVNYDKSRTAPGLKGVDIGFMLMRRDLINMIPEGNVSFESTLYPRLVAERKLSAYVTGHRYYSVGSHARLSLTEVFLARRPAVIVDRDGVLNVKMPRAEYVRSWSDWRWADGALDALVRFSAAGFRVIVVTNQAGIARGVMNEADLAIIHERMNAEVIAAGGRIDAIYHCPHGWNDGCNCRKPKPGMLFQAQREFDLDLSRVCFVGDDDRDGQAADAAGCRFSIVSGEEPLSKIADRIIREAS
jgi:histidinol-phosphate phosphatase family protein